MYPNRPVSKSILPTGLSTLDMGNGTRSVPNINGLPAVISMTSSLPYYALSPQPLVSLQEFQTVVRGVPIIQPVRNHLHQSVLAEGAWPQLPVTIPATHYQHPTISGSKTRDVSMPSFAPEASALSAAIMYRYGSVVESDLQQIRPEAFSCILPDLVKCQTSKAKPMSQFRVPVTVLPVAPPTHFTKEAISCDIDQCEIQLQLKPTIPGATNYSGKPNLPSARPKQKALPKPKAKPIQLGRPRKPLPENKPFFTPLPMGARHVDPQDRPWGSRMTKQMWAKKAVLQKPILQTSRCGGTVKTLAQLITEKHLPNCIVTNSSTGVSNSLSVPDAVRSVKNVDEVQPVSKKVRRADSTVHSDKTTKLVPSAEEPNVVDEYEVEYLYLTKIILRKKKPTIPKPSSEQICRKRKFLEDNIEMWRRSKQARMEPQNVADDSGGTPGCLPTLSSDTRDF